MYFISQNGKQDCAFTCLSIMLANYQKDKNYLFLRHEDRQYNFKELISIAKDYGLTLLGVKVDNPDEILKHDTFPIIVTLLGSSKNSKHSVVLLKINKHFATYYDPALGKRRITYREFMDKWQRVALIFKEKVPTPCPIVAEEFYDKKDKIILSTLQIFSGISLLVGTYFLGNNVRIFVPIIFLAAFMIFEVLFRFYLIKAMDKIDENIYSYKVNKPEGGYLEVFETIQKYRVNALTLLSNIIYSLMISVFIIIITLMNNIWNLLYIVSAFCIAGIEFFAIDPFFKQKEDKIIEGETKVVEAEEDYEFALKARDVSQMASKIGFQKIFSRYIEVMFVLVLSLLVNSLNKSINITYIVFYVCVSVFLSTNLKKIFDFTKSMDTYDSTKAKLINYLKKDNASENYL